MVNHQLDIQVLAVNEFLLIEPSGVEAERIWAIIAVDPAAEEASIQQLGLALARWSVDCVWALGVEAGEVAEVYAKAFPGKLACMSNIQGLEASLSAALSHAQAEGQSPKILLMDQLNTDFSFLFKNDKK